MVTAVHKLQGAGGVGGGGDYFIFNYASTIGDTSATASIVVDDDKNVYMGGRLYVGGSYQNSKKALIKLLPTGDLVFHKDWSLSSYDNNVYDMFIGQSGDIYAYGFNGVNSGFSSSRRYGSAVSIVDTSGNFNSSTASYITLGTNTPIFYPDRSCQLSTGEVVLSATNSSASRATLHVFDSTCSTEIVNATNNSTTTARVSLAPDNSGNFYCSWCSTNYIAIAKYDSSVTKIGNYQVYTFSGYSSAYISMKKCDVTGKIFLHGFIIDASSNYYGYCAEYDGSSITNEFITSGLYADSSNSINYCGEDLSGNRYIVTYGGKVAKINSSGIVDWCNQIQIGGVDVFANSAYVSDDAVFASSGGTLFKVPLDGSGTGTYGSYSYVSSSLSLSSTSATSGSTTTTSPATYSVSYNFFSETPYTGSYAYTTEPI